MALANRLNPVIISILVCFFACADVSGCVNEDPCLCQIDEYNKIDLTPVSQNLKLNEFLEDGDLHGNGYYFHGCKNGVFNTTARNINVNTTISNATIFQGSLIHTNTSDVKKNATVEVLGKNTEIKIFPVKGKKDSYQIIYKQNENVTARVYLICTNLEVSTIKFLPINGPDPSLTLSSPHACIITHHPGLSTGSVLVIIFFVALGVYFIGGCVILYFMRGARGAEMIPNVDFWRSLPGLVKDGIIFLFSGCSATSITTPETYDRI